MGLFEKFSDAEKTAMRKYIDWYALDDGYCGTRANLDHILRIWDESKSQYLYKMLGEKFDIAKDIAIAKDKSMMEDELEDTLFRYGSDGFEFVDAFRDYSWHHRYDEKENFVEAMDLMGDMLSYDYLVPNVYTGKAFTLKFLNGDEFKVNTGCKLSKALGKIAEGFNLPGYEKFRIAHSQVLNQKIFKGELHLTIHPLDYMTMSDNDCGWQSCMSWTDDGEYRRGTVEMMNSVSVVEAYMPSSTPMHIGDFEWNNKKWRQLFIVAPTFIVAVKGYPYWNRDLEAETMKWIKDLAEQNLGYGPYFNTKYTFHSTDSFFVNELQKDVRFRFYTDAMYCDIYDDHSAFVSNDILEETEFYYSGPSECMCCGSVEHSFDGEQTLMCDYCDDSLHCYNCGDRINRDDAYYVDGDYYCQYCYEDLPCCNACSDVHTRDCMNRVYIASLDGKGLTTYDAEFCDNCWDRYELEDKVKHFSRKWDSYNYVTIDDIDDDLAEVFGFDDAEDAKNRLHRDPYVFINFEEKAS